MVMIPPLETLETKMIHEASAGLEQCVDQLSTFVEGLPDYAESTLAFALRIHLAGLLQAMVEQRLWTHEDVRTFVLELEQEALGVGEE
jgi:hypothetical protein